VIFWTRRPLKALQRVLEFIEDRLQEFAPRMGPVRGTPRGAWSDPFRRGLGRIAPARGGALHKKPKLSVNLMILYR
jgi:hypothetical protein